MKYLAIIPDNGSKQAIVFDNVFRALKYQAKNKNVKIEGANLSEYRLVRHRRGEEDIEYRFSSYKKALKQVQKELGTLNEAETAKSEWQSHDAKRISYKLYIATVKPYSGEVINRYAVKVLEKKQKKDAKTAEKAPSVFRNGCKPWTAKRTFAAITIPAFIVTLTVLGTLVGVKTDWQMLADEMSARDFEPTAEIKEIAETLRLTRKGKSIFYATRPQLQKSGTFNMGCGSDGENSYTLGCYWKDDDEKAKEHLAVYNTEVDELRQGGIYYNFVADRNVTTLHEMLHAAYERLNEDEKTIMCGAARVIVGEIGDLSSALELYPKEQYCTEAFARIGSEYIISLVGHDDEYSVVSRDKISKKAQIASDIMAEQYQKYFDYNYELHSMHNYNVAIKKSLRSIVNEMMLALQKEKAYVNYLINAFQAYPSVTLYYAALDAIDEYNDHVEIFKTYYMIYAQINNTLDSEVSSTLAKF